MTRKTVAIIGGGASGLFAAAHIDSSKFDVTIYEINKTLGRKFLVAGDGGFNLTHSESIEEMIKRYTPKYFLEKSLLQFNNLMFREWLHNVDIPTFVGSSRRVFPEEGIKPIEVLNAIKKRLIENNVNFNFEESWSGWKADNSLIFNSGLVVKADIVIFSLGGASWKVTGSDGNWHSIFHEKGIDVLPFESSNCAYEINWPESFIQNNDGEPLKNISVTCNAKTVKGELVVTKFGIEGNAIYALSPEIRSQRVPNGKAIVCIDLKPGLTEEQILAKWKSSKRKNKTDFLKLDLNLSKVQVKMLKTLLSKDEFLDDNVLIEKIKKLSIEIIGSGDIDEAISTVGGVSLHEVTTDYELKKYPNHYCIGEMLNWDAPTGGYLLQACFSMGMKIASVLNK